MNQGGRGKRLRVKRSDGQTEGRGQGGENEQRVDGGEERGSWELRGTGGSELDIEKG